MNESKTEVVWPRKETRPIFRRKKDSGDGTTWEKKKRKTETEMDGRCQLSGSGYKERFTKTESSTILKMHRTASKMFYLSLIGLAIELKEMPT